VIDDPEFEIALRVGVLREFAVEGDFAVGLVGIPENPQITARDLGILDFHVSIGRHRICRDET